MKGAAGLAKKPRITCVLGSGATLNIGGPSTDDITAAARQKQQHVPLPDGNWGYVPFVDELGRELDNFLRPEKSSPWGDPPPRFRANFEDILHVLETLESYRAGWDTGTAPDRKPRPGAFFRPSDARWFDEFRLLTAKQDVMCAIAEQVDQSIQRFDPSNGHKWFTEFWTRAFRRADFNIGTLNYDDILERIAPDLEDGYRPVNDSNFAPFEVARLQRCARIRLLHLHGSYLFGYPPGGSGASGSSYSFDELWKFGTHAAARKTWFNRSTNQAQAHEDAIIGALITGLRKPDKLTVSPYDEYQAVLREALRRSPRLLVVGYSFGDPYLNSILNRMPAYHGNGRRIAVISYIDPKKWHCSSAYLNQRYMWPGMEMLTFFGHAMRTVEPLGKSMQFRDVLESGDRRCRLYLGGTKQAFREHGDKILDFLTS